MENKSYPGSERRHFFRLDYTAPIACKICKKETISKILQGYTSNISQSGLLCSLEEEVHEDDIVWLFFDRSTLDICEELEKKCLIYQHGIIGKVVRVENKKDGKHDIGIQFITREEKNLTYIYPKIYFLNQRQDEGNQQA